MSGTVVIGGGQAGFTVVDSLRRLGYAEPITLVDAAEELPYRRPPLSKTYLTGDLTAEGLCFRPVSYYVDNDITLILGTSLTGVDHTNRSAVLSDGRSLHYDHLVIATGSMLRPWPSHAPLPAGTHRLHDRTDAEELRESLGRASKAVVIGAGFIGLEFASAASKAGLDVTVLEAARRPLARSSSPLASQALIRLHRDHGVDLRCSTAVRQILGDTQVAGVELLDGDRLEADLVLVGIGSVPALGAETIGVIGSSDGAITVDDGMRSSDPRVLACGDGVSFRHGDRWIRLESVQNATDQARCAAATILGVGAPYEAVPWFWTEQYGHKLQIAGLLDQAEDFVVRGDISTQRWTVLGFRNGQLLGSESLSAVGDHMATRTLLRTGVPLTPAQAADPDFDLRAHAAGAQPAAHQAQLIQGAQS